MTTWIILSFATVALGGMIADFSLETSCIYHTEIGLGGIVIMVGGLISIVGCVVTIFYGMAT